MIVSKKLVLSVLVFFGNTSQVPALNSYLEEKLDGFKIYWKIFDIFLPCRAHFTRVPEAWLDMHDSFLKRCRQLNYCVNLQTAYPYPLRRHQFGIALQKIWYNNSVKNITATFWKIFGSHHFHGVCTVRIAFSAQNGTNSMSEEERGDQTDKLILPSKNYILLPITFKERNNSQLIEIFGPPLANSVLLCLSQNHPSVYMACLTCPYNLLKLRLEFKSYKYDWLHSKPLIVLPIFPTSLSELDSIYMFYHFRRPNRQTSFRKGLAKRHDKQYNDSFCIWPNGDAMVPRKCFKSTVLHYFNFTGHIRAGADKVF